jgi:hypothetical protein
VGVHSQREAVSSADGARREDWLAVLPAAGIDTDCTVIAMVLAGLANGDELMYGYSYSPSRAGTDGDEAWMEKRLSPTVDPSRAPSVSPLCCRTPTA